MAGARDDETEPILLATDFSDDSEAAFAWALHAARAFGAPLLVLHVVHDPLDHPGTYANNAGSSAEKLEDVAREMLDAWIERMLAEETATEKMRTAVTSSLAVGIPETRIIEVAARERARMIVMGGLGQARLAERLLGSRAERVARLSPIPVTIVRKEEPADDSDAAGTA